MLLWSVKHRLPQARGLRIVHFNQINHLAPALAKLGEVVETCHQAGLAPGTPVGGCVNEDMGNLTFPDEQFDLAVHSETLEHLFDFRRALDEVGRVLKPGGIQVYTLPLLHGRTTGQRLRHGPDGSVEALAPPSFHGSEGEFPVVWEFGRDFLQQREPFIQEIHYNNYWTNRTVFAIVEKKP
jgi:SAM-dependent methyltransferase